MVDTASRTQTTAALVADLRAKLAAASDPLVRAALQQAVAALEDSVGAQHAAPLQNAAREASRRILAALAAAGLTADRPSAHHNTQAEAEARAKRILANTGGGEAVIHGRDGRIRDSDAEPADLPFSENALTVLRARYLRRNDQGEVVETPEGMLRRVALAVAEGDRLYNPNADPSSLGASVAASAERFYRIMAKLDFLPNSPTMMNAGTGAGTLSACFVLPLQDSLEAIMETAHDTAMVQKYGGGTGFALSELRPKGAPIATTHGRACGPIAVLRHLSSVSTMITQGGKRDGANMAVMDIHHPDILEFITCKEQEGQIHNFNISVGVDEEFMQAVKDGGRLELRDPKGGVVVKTEDAREVFQKIVDGAWRNGEPGMIFLDRVNQDNPTPHLGQMTATNPCGEQPLLPYESCNLGSINMARMLRYPVRPSTGSGRTEQTAHPELVEGPAEIDWERLRETVWTAVHFLDNVIDVNRYSVPGVERMTKLTRKVGLGVMGFADMLVRLGVPYDSEEGLELGREVMRFIRDEADKASVELAKERGVFPAFKGSRHDRPGGLRLRNSCRLTVAPTGTISMIAGCSSGIEPIFALAYRKQNILEGKTLYYTDAAFEATARHDGFWSDGLVESLSQGASLKDRNDVPAWAQRVFATAPDIAPDWHVRMQAVFQESTDAAISKTINFPNQATADDVRTAYLLAWELGCKGITVYRAGSREKEVLTAGTAAKPSTKSGESADSSPTDSSVSLRPRERPQVMRGLTERVRTAYGNMYVTITFDDDGRPFEAFARLGKAGGTDSANLEAVARLVSMSLRSGVAPEEVVEQLRGITSEPVWDQGVLVRSAPDAVAIALSRAIERVRSGELGMAVGSASARGLEAEQPALFPKDAVASGAKEPFAAAYRSASVGAAGVSSPVGHAPAASARAGWVACPKCSGPLVMQEGCETCRECGFSRCG